MMRLSECAVIAVMLCGCTTRTVHQGPVDQTIRARPGEMLIITNNEGRRLRIWDAHVANDSLMGVERHQFRPGQGTREERDRGYAERAVRIALADVRTVETSRVDAGKTVALLGGMVAVLFLALMSAVDAAY